MKTMSGDEQGLVEDGETEPREEKTVGALTVEDVQAYVKANLARYKVPRDVVFVSELPRNATGKILKRELRTHR